MWGCHLNSLILRLNINWQYGTVLYDILHWVDYKLTALSVKKSQSRWVFCQKIFCSFKFSGHREVSIVLNKNARHKESKQTWITKPIIFNVFIGMGLIHKSLHSFYAMKRIASLSMYHFFRNRVESIGLLIKPIRRIHSNEPNFHVVRNFHDLVFWSDKTQVKPKPAISLSAIWILKRAYMVLLWHFKFNPQYSVILTLSVVKRGAIFAPCNDVRLNTISDLLAFD